MKLFSYILVGLIILAATAFAFMLKDSLAYSLKSGPPKRIEHPEDLEENSFSSLKATVDKVIKIRRKKTTLYLIPLKIGNVTLFVLRFREPAIKGKTYVFSGRLVKARKGTFAGEAVSLAGIKERPWVLIDGVKPDRTIFYIFAGGLLILVALTGSTIHFIRKV